ncbi:hypothetical protein JTB14_036694 [Gonioctena quinquepunctata]|nr:hypothetical protein JTB14_036694 [Gonioctena quinquepunctata]
MGRFSDGNIFASSALRQKIISNSLHLPKSTLVPSCDIYMPYVFVADESFPLAKHIMRPYPRQKVIGNKDNKICNYRLSRARQTVECAFGILASRFRVFRKAFESKVDTVVRVGEAACVLHNYSPKNWNPHSHEEPNDDIPTNQLIPMRRVNTNSTQQAFEIRRRFTTYFTTVGVVSWQEESIARGKF